MREANMTKFPAEAHNFLIFNINLDTLKTANLTYYKR